MVINEDENSSHYPHFTVNGYANAWHIAKKPNDQKLTIYYKGQDYFKLGSYISLSVVLLFTIPFMRSKYENSHDMKQYS